MTDGPDNSLTASGAATQWQIPLLLLGLVACGAAVAVFVIHDSPRDWEAQYVALAADVDRVRDGNYVPLARQVETMLSPAVTPSDQYERRARLHGLMGEILWRSIQQTAQPTPEQWTGLRESYQQVAQCGGDLPAEAAERLGEAAAATGDAAEAVTRFTQALEADPARRAALLRRIIELRRGAGKAPVDEQLEALRRYIAADGLTADDYDWGIGEAVDLLIGAGRLHEAAALIADEQSRDHPDAFGPRLGYHRSRVLARRGLVEQADNLLISLIDPLPPSSPVRHRCELLRGQLIWRDNPADAVTLFEHVVDVAAGEPMATAARVGLVQAYGSLQLAERALAECERAVEDLADAAHRSQADLDELRSYLAEASRDHALRGRHDLTLRFVRAEQALAALLPGARFVPMEGRWHAPDPRDLSEIAEAIDALLAGDPR